MGKVQRRYDPVDQSRPTELCILQHKASGQLTDLYNYIAKAARKPIHFSDFPAEHPTLTRENEGHVDHTKRKIIIHLDTTLDARLLEAVAAHELLHVALHLDGFSYELTYDDRQFRKAAWIPSFVNGLMDSLEHLLINPKLLDLGFAVSTLVEKHQRNWFREVKQARQRGRKMSSAFVCGSASKWLQWAMTKQGVETGILREWFEDWLPEALELGEKWVDLVLARGYTTPNQQAESLAAILTSLEYRGIPLLGLFRVSPLPTFSAVSHPSWIGSSVLAGITVTN
jgi:hypothetical protein